MRGVIGMSSILGRIGVAATTYAPHHLKDDGHVARDSRMARQQFLVDYAIKKAKAQGIDIAKDKSGTITVQIDDWESVWDTIPKSNNDFSINADNDKGPINNASSWLGSMGDFQVKGTYTIHFSPGDNGINADVTNTNLQWRWVDRIDAHSYMEYDWKKNSWGQGVLEGAVDLLGDKVVGASFDVYVDYVDRNSYRLIRFFAENVGRRD